MVDMASISAALASIKTATDIAKWFKETDLSFEKAETKLKLAELISALADTKIQMADIKQLLLDKDAELRAAKEQLSVKENILWESPYYWLDDDGKKDGPFCQRCHDVDKKLVRLQGVGNDEWWCLQCKMNYKGPRYQKPPERQVNRTSRSRWMDGY